MTIGRGVLLVEDERFLRRAAEASLRQRGFVTGIEVLRAHRAHEATESIPVPILSISSREQDVEELKGLGVTDYLVKANPSLQELGDRVARLLEG